MRKHYNISNWACIEVSLSQNPLKIKITKCRESAWSKPYIDTIILVRPWTRKSITPLALIYFLCKTGIGISLLERFLILETMNRRLMLWNQVQNSCLCDCSNLLLLLLLIVWVKKMDLMMAFSNPMERNQTK